MPWKRSPTKRTVLVAVDMTDAYDRVNKTSLLYKMTDMDVPPCMMRWIRNFLADRRARVAWDETASAEVKMREGLPQGGVISPLLWLCYINDLAPVLRRHDVQIGMYADDLIIYASDSSVPTAQAKVQAAMDEVEEWAYAWNMTISATKTKTILFTSNVHEVNSKKKVDICLGDTTIQQTSEVTVLGVVFDTQLSFTQHVQQLKGKLAKRLQVTKALAGTTWGCSSVTLRRMYCQFIQPVALYGSAAYMSLSRKTNREKMDQVAAAGDRIITGCPAAHWSETPSREATGDSGTVTRKMRKRLVNRQTWREEATKIAKEALLEETEREAIWNRPDTDGLCPECGVPEDTEHVVCECPKYQAARSALLGHTPTLTVLQEDPDAVLRFFRRTGLLPEAR
ncbi:RNA-directed DNA polymerase from mobile element jockey [Amphibalanus amphitrite]|uniref:RNA-directed DNA polymerase from mobile element jockey n=1 Tax=Amphibalanus amphitrite TaxID=1232801 RepID=A0A6A4WYI9_AMPAM|nr:RNA-directed DNA polymerase from mobile element jockey [Amphibalanus amphitrite]